MISATLKYLAIDPVKNMLLYREQEHIRECLEYSQAWFAKYGDFNAYTQDQFHYRNLHRDLLVHYDLYANGPAYNIERQLERSVQQQATLAQTGDASIMLRIEMSYYTELLQRRKKKSRLWIDNP